jgi:hypothetical protein
LPITKSPSVADVMVSGEGISPAKQPMKHRISRQAAGLLAAAGVLISSNVMLDALHNSNLRNTRARYKAQLQEATARYDAQLAEQAERYRAETAKQAEEFNARLSEREARYNARLVAKGIVASPVSSAKP